MLRKISFWYSISTKSQQSFHSSLQTVQMQPYVIRAASKILVFDRAARLRDRIFAPLDYL